MLQAQNAQHKAQAGPQPVETVEGKGFMEWVDYFRLNHRMSTWEAQLATDKVNPGLWLFYINERNKSERQKWGW